MADPTVPCPNCPNYVLEDTPQCLRCGFRFATGRVEPIEKEPLASELDATTREISCPSCQVGVREHLVRCWNCGGFMRPEIAAAYERMKRRRTTATAARTGSGTGAADDEDVGSLDESLHDAGITPVFSPREEEFDDLDFELDPTVARSEVSEPSEPAPAPPERTTRDAAAETAPAAPGEPSAPPPPTEEEQESEAEPTGDPLLDIALAEERESKSRQAEVDAARRKRTATGKTKRSAKGAAASGKRQRTRKKAAKPAAGRYRFWMEDLALHEVDPKKVKKPKPGCLAKPTRSVDLGISPEGLLLVSLSKPRALFGKPPKPAEVRREVIAHLAADKSLDDLPAGDHWTVEKEQVNELRFEQPNEYAHERTFGDVPVFGEGRIGLRLPRNGEEETVVRFLSFSLGGFRRFAARVAQTCETAAFENVHGVPLETKSTELSCHYTDETMNVLEDADFYLADPQMETRVVGYRCESCGLIVSEDGRKKERIGGKAGKGLAKAKCPKCGNRFGRHPLHELVTVDEGAKKDPARGKRSRSAEKEAPVASS